MMRIVGIVAALLAAAAAFGQPAEEATAPSVEEMESLIASCPKQFWEPMLTLAPHPAILERIARKEIDVAPRAGEAPRMLPQTRALQRLRLRLAAI
jgi:hypothetical protein